MTNTLRFVRVATLVLLAGLSMRAQSTRGTLLGRVSDPTGSAIPQAQVVIENQGTALRVEITSSADGDYAATNVEPGLYRVTITAPGFKTRVARDVVVQVNQTVRLDSTLEVGDVNTRLEVEAVAPVIQTDASAVGNVVNGKQITQMPLNGRNNLNGLLALAPGVQGTGTNPYIGGNYGFGVSNLTIDGVGGNDIGNERNMTTVPSLDSIGEFKVIANGASAEFGQGGAQIVVAMKAGTNDLRGSFFYFNRNRATAANNFFSNRAGLPNPKYNRNEYGVAVGGPILKNKLFYFGSFEGFRQASAVTNTIAMPTTAMRSGNFSALGTVIKDPFTGIAFPGNIIPTNRISPVAQGLDKFFSAPNLPGVGASGLGANYTVNVGQTEPVDRYSIKVDYLITDRDRISGRYFKSADGPYNATGSLSDKFGNWNGFGNDTNNTMFNYIRVVTPNLINEARFGWQDNHYFRTPQNNDFDPSALIPGLIKPVAGLGGLPTVTILGFAGFLDQPGSGDRQANYELTESLNWSHGRHTVKGGVGFQRVSSFNRQNTPPYRGNFAFDGRYSGNAFADFLIGALDASGRNSRNALNESVDNRYSAFLQDDWQVSNRLTVNAGVRYEYQGLFQNSQGDLSNFVPSLNAMVVVSGMADANPLLLSTLPIVDGAKAGYDTSNYTHPDRNNFAPRLGFAWRPFNNSRFVVRSSYGWFYAVIAGYNFLLSQGVTNPPFRVQESFPPDPGTVPSLTWANPFPGQGTIPTSPAIIAQAVNRVNPYIQEWNFTTEYEVVKNLAFRASYVASKGTHLERNGEINEPPNAPGPIQARRPYQPWGSITYWESGRNSIVNSVQAGLVRRYSSGLTFQVEYQFNKGLGEYEFGTAPSNPQDFRYDRGNLDSIRAHWVVGNYSYDLPFGQGKLFGSSVSGWGDRLIGGWQLNGIVTAGSGAPYSVTFTPTQIGWIGNRANVSSYGAATPSNRSIDQWFNPAAFSIPAPFTYGTSARNALFGPGLFSWDAGVFKAIRITERVRSTFRAELFNATNHTSFGLPATNLSVPASVGRITSTSVAARTVQFGLRLDF
jgi:hypothetical protein